MGEFYICREIGIPGEKVFISGGGEEKRGHQADPGSLPGKMSLQCRISQPVFRYGTVERGEQKSQFSLYLRLAGDSQFGMEEKAIRKLIRNRDVWPYVKIRGIHYFSGTLKKPGKMEKELEFLDRCLGELEEDCGFFCRGAGIWTGAFCGLFSGTRGPDFRGS